MFSKHKAPSALEGCTSSHRIFTDDVDDLFAENLISASRAQGLINKAHAAGIKAVKKKVKPTGRNAARALRARKLKRTLWPHEYTCTLTFWDRKAKALVRWDTSMHLIHEILQTIWRHGFEAVILSTEMLDSQAKQQFDWMKTQLALDSLLGFGIHGDGVPCNWDRTASVMVISLNLPGVGKEYTRMRIPLLCMPSHMVTSETMDGIMEVFAWSMRHLLSGTNPICRHDGSPWEASDAQRSKTPLHLGFNACLCEVRGDWDFYSKCFHFPYHSEIEGVCWKCPCRRDEVC